MPLNARARELLKKHDRAIAHLRRQKDERRLGLVFGAGVSKSIGFPDWEELIERVAAHGAVDGVAIIKSPKKRDPQASRAQMLFQRFKSRRYESEEPQKHHTLELDLTIRREWREIVQKCLYEKVDVHAKITDQHPYLKEYVSVITESALTVNYNFDDSLERLLDEQSTSAAQKRRYETIWDGGTQLSTDRTAIYHPNGFLPSNLLENPSEQLVFGEDSFADQLIASMAGHYSSLLHHLFKHTCLFVGVSLDDGTLKHLLRQNARINPGHYHYYVAFVGDAESVDPARAAAIQAANFDVYNLITLFLTDSDIAALGSLLTTPDTEFKNCCEEVGAGQKFCYYLCGAVGAGKTTTLSYLRSLATHDEWLEPRPALLAKPFTELTDSEKDDVDKWIANQFARKNLNLLNSPPGVHIVDRSPLDPIAFTPSAEWPKKAAQLRGDISPGAASGRTIQPGQVIFLDGEPGDLVIRNASRHRRGDKTYLAQQQELLKFVYAHRTLTVVDVRGLTAHEVVKRVAQVIHLGAHAQSDLDSLLRDVEKGTVKHEVTRAE